MTRIIAIIMFFLLFSTSTASARSDWFCGLATGHICPGMVILATKHHGSVHSHLSATYVADEVARQRPKHVILAGHSAGCSAAVNAAWRLHQKKVPVDLLLCFDGATMFMSTKTVPPNVKLTVSWRQNGFWGGARLCAGKQRKSYSLMRNGKELVFSNACVQHTGGGIVIESTLFIDHFTVGGFNQFINTQVETLIKR